MNAKSMRAAVCVLGAVAVTAGTGGCSSAPEETGQTNQGIQGPIRIPPLNVVTSETSAPQYNGASCPNEWISIPNALSGYGCTYGTEIQNDPNLPPATFPGGAQAYAWACPSWVSSSTLSWYVQSKQWGGPEPSGTNILVDTAPQVDSCFGYPDSGWQVILERPEVVFCVEPVFAKMGLSVKELAVKFPDVKPLVQVCTWGQCNCPPGTTVLQ